ncbi:hypothetical protein [Nocardiopsis synnemataformans]|uniref:hypothetical protein n=1 Tax=Nocardiopsis synnemataformans TaxID=61305 RepID=UPI003EBF77CB
MTSTNTTSTAIQSRCCECGRLLHNPSADGYGPKCRRKTRRSVQAEVLSGHSTRVAGKAALVLKRRRAITATGPDTYTVRGSFKALYTVVIAPELDGKVAEICSCTAGHYGKECNHVVAVRALVAVREHGLAA